MQFSCIGALTWFILVKIAFGILPLLSSMYMVYRYDGKQSLYFFILECSSPLWILAGFSRVRYCLPYVGFQYDASVVLEDMVTKHGLDQYKDAWINIRMAANLRL